MRMYKSSDSWNLVIPARVQSEVFFLKIEFKVKLRAVWLRNHPIIDEMTSVYHEFHFIIFGAMASVIPGQIWPRAGFLEFERIRFSGIQTKVQIQIYLKT